MNIYITFKLGLGMDNQKAVKAILNWTKVHKNDVEEKNKHVIVHFKFVSFHFVSSIHHIHFNSFK